MILFYISVTAISSAFVAYAKFKLLLMLRDTFYLCHQLVIPVRFL